MHSLFNSLATIVPLRHKNRVRHTQLRYMTLKRRARDLLVRPVQRRREV